MKKIGLIGGIGPESTIDYYRGIIEAFKPTYNLTGYPEMCIESLNMKKILNLAESDKWDYIAQMLVEKCRVLYSAGADFGAIASNTPHRVFNQVQSGTDLVLISIVESTLKAAQKMNYKRLCLLGTKFTMESDFYADTFQKVDIKLYVPDIDKRNYIQSKLSTEIELGIIKEETKKGIITIVEEMEKKIGVEGVIVGCTELPLIIKKSDMKIGYLNTAQIHIDCIVEYCKQ